MPMPLLKRSWCLRRARQFIRMGLLSDLLHRLWSRQFSLYGNISMGTSGWSYREHRTMKRRFLSQDNRSDNLKKILVGDGGKTTQTRD